MLTTSTRLIPKADRKKVHEYLFRGMSDCYNYFNKEEVDGLVAEGVLVAKKDFNLPKHNEIDTKNLYVGSFYLKLVLVLTSSGCQSMPVAHLSRLFENPVFMAMVLLYAHTRRSRLPARMATCTG